MYKCLHCEDENTICLSWYFDAADDPISPIYGDFICSNGHLNGIVKKIDGSHHIFEVKWYLGIPGSLSHLRIFDFKKKSWCIYNIYSSYLNTNVYMMFKEYLKQQNQLKSETSASRLEWLKCSLKLNICIDIRLLIGKKYIKPSEFWE